MTTSWRLPLSLFVRLFPNVTICSLDENYMGYFTTLTFDSLLADELRKLSWAGVPTTCRPITWKILCVSNCNRINITMSWWNQYDIPFEHRYYPWRPGTVEFPLPKSSLVTCCTAENQDAIRFDLFGGTWSVTPMHAVHQTALISHHCFTDCHSLSGESKCKGRKPCVQPLTAIAFCEFQPLCSKEHRVILPSGR